MAFDQIRSGSILSDVYDGAELAFYVPAPPVRKCDGCGHALAKSNREALCFCCLRKQPKKKLPVASDREIFWESLDRAFELERLAG